MLKNTIGHNADVIWNILSKNGQTTINEISKVSKIKEHDILLAAGWLAKDGKITISTSNGSITLETNKIGPDFYY